MVTWRVPSSRLTTPTAERSTPSRKIFPPWSTSTGGQVFAQSPEQFDFDGDGVSLSNRYRVKPAPLSTTGLSAPALPADSCTHFIAAALASAEPFAPAWAKSPVPGCAPLPTALPESHCTASAAGAGAGVPLPPPEEHAERTTAPARPPEKPLHGARGGARRGCPAPSSGETRGENHRARREQRRRDQAPANRHE